MRRPGFLLATAAFLSVAAISNLSHAQPTAITPQDMIQQRQFTDTSSDWSDTPFYDLENPVEMVVVIEDLVTTNEGNVELLFSMSSFEGRALSKTEDRPLHRAVLQRDHEFEQLKIGNRAFGRGVEARLYGWPATRHNRTPAILLVDEIEILASGKVHAFHPEHERMKKKRDKKDKKDKNP